jgi:hypothetical protein
MLPLVKSCGTPRNMSFKSAQNDWGCANGGSDSVVCDTGNTEERGDGRWSIYIGHLLPERRAEIVKPRVSS